MQRQLFGLVDAYQESDKPIGQLYITGHSLGSALSELFTLDIAMSRPDVVASNLNFACPRIGNREFVAYYERQKAQSSPSTRTLRVQNTFDIVPCVPPENLGYRQLRYVYLVAFYMNDHFGKVSILGNHSALNYQAVISSAAKSADGVCICEKLEITAKGHSITSMRPDQNSVCESTT